MGLFNKKEEIPSIPTTSRLPELPKTDIPTVDEPAHSLPELPSFPPNSKNENLNREMVKSAVADMPSPGEEEVHVEIPKDLHITEEPERESMIPSMPSKKQTTYQGMQSSIADANSTGPIPDLPKKETISKTPTTTWQKHTPNTGGQIEQREPIFIRIDKFQSAQKNFEHIKDKVKEIESVLKKIKDVKSQEEVELKGWTEDVEQIKSRLAEIDAGIFEQI
ncbi:MAG: hypothetical protein KJ592_01555 [Nanoarchaeota archaeon]|nr:hypothetical protein [Nanoarchaeota archaeon]